MALEPTIEQFLEFFASSPDLMAVLTPEGEFLRFNKAWEQGLGYSPGSLEGMDYLDLILDQDRSQTQITLARFLQDGQPFTLENRIKSKKQDPRWILWTWYPLERGEGFLIHGHDTTEKSELKKALEESRGKFQRLSESAKEGIAIHDKGIIVEANQALATMMGYQHPEELIGIDGFDFPAPEYRALARENAARGYNHPYEAVFQRKDGSRFNGLVCGKPIQHQGRFMRVTTFLDITPLKKREQELLESQELFRKLTEASKDGVAVSDRGKILFANQALARIFGSEITEMIGRNAVEFTAPEFRESILQKITGDEEKPYETMGLRMDGTRFPLEITPRMTTFQGRKVRVAFFRDITQRKKMEEEAERQKEFSQNLIHSSIDGLLAFDLEYRYTLWNSAMERISGHSREEVLGQRAFDVFPFLKQIGEDKYFTEALEGKTAFSQERPYRTPAGKQGFFEAHYMPLKTKQGKIIGGLGIIHEVTERKQALEALRRSEINLKAVFNNTLQNIVLMDVEAKIIDYNENAASFLEEVSGLPVKKGENFFQYIVSSHMEAAKTRFKKALQGEVASSERTIPFTDGSNHWYEVNYNPVFGHLGEIEGVCFTCVNIDDRKKAEEALQKSEADLRSVFNSGHQSVILTGKDGIIRDFNANAERSLKETRGQDLEIGKPLADYVETEFVEPFQERFKNVLRGETVRIERPVQRLDGKAQWFEFSYNPVFDSQNKVLGVCLTIHSIDERKRAEEALQKSENNLKAIFNSVSQNVVLLNQDGIIQAFNQRAFEDFQRATGRGLETGVSFESYIRTGDKEPFLDRFSRAKKGERVFFERSYPMADGTEHWFEFSYNPVLGDQAHIAGVCFVSSLIDERKKAEKALQESEEKFRRIFEEASIGMTLVDKQFRFLKVNRAFSDMLGYRPEEFLEKTFVDFTHPDDLSRNRHLTDQLVTGQGFQLQKRYLHKSGKTIWANLTVTPMMSAKGDLLYTVGMIEDVTERNLAGELLKESEEKFRRIFEDASTAMAMVSDYKFIKVNRAFLNLLGYAEKEIIGKTLFEITHPEDLTKTQTIASEMHHEEKDHFQTEKRYLRKDGESLWANVSGTLIRDGMGRKLYSLIMIENITGKKMAQDELKKSEASLRAVYNSGTQMVGLVDQNGHFLDCNQAAASAMLQLTGIGYEKGRPIYDYLHLNQDLKEIFRDYLRRSLRGEVLRVEKPMKALGEADHWMEFNFQPVRESDGSIARVCITAVLVDERKSAEETLRRYAAELDAVFNSGSQVSVLIGRDGRIQRFNKFAAQMAPRVLGQPIREGMAFVETLPPGASAAQFRDSFEAALAGKESNGERVIRSAEGKERWVEVGYRPVLNLEGGVEGVCFILAFIDERKKVEAELRESQERFQRLAEVTQEGILLHENPRVVDINPALSALLGYTREEMIGKSGFDFLATESHEMALGHMRAGSMEPYEAVAVRKDGSRVPIELQGRNFHYKGKDLRVMSVRDLTERKRIQSKLLQYERLAAVGKVIAAIAHEVRNPLAVISGMSQILKSKVGSDPSHSQELSTIRDQSERLKMFMNDILDYSREMEIRRQKVEIPGLIEKSLVTVQTQVGPSHVNVEVQRDWKASLPEVSADGQRLEQVLENLILNAYQSMQDKGNLTLSCRQQGEWLVIGVMDDGPGIQEADFPHLFEPFFTTKKHGSGLGLPISQKIMEAHGGRIEVQKVAPHGTRFNLYLPLVRG